MKAPSRQRRATLLRAAIAAIAFSGAGASAAADITLKNAWMRPARAGSPTAAVYVDVRTDVPLKLVAARSPIAKSAGFVLVDQNPDGTTTERPVKEADIPGVRRRDSPTTAAASSCATSSIRCRRARTSRSRWSSSRRAAMRGT